MSERDHLLLVIHCQRDLLKAIARKYGGRITLTKDEINMADRLILEQIDSKDDQGNDVVHVQSYEMIRYGNR